MTGPVLPLFRTLLLDAHGLSSLAGRAARTRDLVSAATRLDADVLIPWTVLAETLHGRGKREREHALSGLVLAPLEERHYRSAARLMDRTGMAGHPIDALVAAVALTCPRPVVIATSDPRDLRQLLEGERGVGVFAI